MYCIDASVIVNAHLPKEQHSEKSRDFLAGIQARNEKVFLPEILIPEVTSGIFRATKDSSFTLDYVQTLRMIPNFIFVSVDRYLADLASQIILESGLKGADALYVAVAHTYSVVLITLDKEQLKRINGIVSARLP